MINNVITEHLNNITKEEEQIETEEEQEKALIIERMKSLSYNQGAEDTRIHYESIVSKLQLENDFSSILYSKIEDINPVVNIDTQISKLSAEIISSIAKKIYLILPVDFELMLEQELLSRLQKFYKEGQIKLIINPSKYDLCRKVLAIENLPLKYKIIRKIGSKVKSYSTIYKYDYCKNFLETRNGKKYGFDLRHIMG